MIKILFYIKTNTEFSYELSEVYKTEQEAKDKLSKMSDKSRLKSEIIHVPNIRVGLMLYRKGEYFMTLIGSSKTLWFAKANDQDEITTPILKEKLIKWYIEGKLDSIEKYQNDITEIKGDD